MNSWQLQMAFTNTWILHLKLSNPSLSHLITIASPPIPNLEILSLVLSLRQTKRLVFLTFVGLYIFQILRCLTVTQTKTQFQKRLMTRTRLKPCNNSNCTTLSSSPFPFVSHLSSSLSSTSFIYVDEAAASTGLLLECVAVVALFPPTISQR